jgi:sulfide:quinone oxidoreductase
MSRKQIVVLGGGSGGIVAASELGRRLGRDHDVILIDRNPFHVYMPAFLMVMTGHRRPRDITRDLSRLKRWGVRVITATIDGIDTGAQTVHLDGQRLGYDELIVSLGLETHPEAIPGSLEAGALHPWELTGALRCHDALTHFEGGRIVVGLPPGPYRCPPAPFETLFSIDWLLSRRGVRDRTTIGFASPNPAPSGPPDSVPVWLEAGAQAREVATHYGFTMSRVDPDQRRLLAEDGRELPYDLLFVVPPHRPAQVLLDSGLAGPTGVKVDPETLATQWPHVWAIGDGADFPGSKAGVVAHQQADVVAHNIAARLTGQGHEERLKLHTT